jgi:hypothetical protein
MDDKYSSNRGWKNKYFFATGQWEFHPIDVVEGLRVPLETCTPSTSASKEPILSEEKMSHVNKLLVWAQQNRDLMSYSKLFVAAMEVEHLNPIEGVVGVTRRRSAPGAISDPQWAASGPLAANTQGVTPQKPIIDKGKKKTNKGKGKIVEPQKLEKFQLHTSESLRIGGAPKKPVAPNFGLSGL